MATQTIEFGFDAGSTISVKATPVGDISTVFTANTVSEVRGGLYRAAIVKEDPDLAEFLTPVPDWAKIVDGVPTGRVIISKK